MIAMDGLLLAQPERVLMGRASWKPRYVVLGTGAHLRIQSDIVPLSNRKSLRVSSTRQGAVDMDRLKPEEFYLTIYRSKNDLEILEQKPLANFQSCEVRNIAYRKQSSLVPTLVLELKPDVLLERQRRRRSSRAGALTSPKDAWADVYLFRTMTEERFSIFDWQLVLSARLTSPNNMDSPRSPESPDFSTFVDPFASRDAGPDTGRAVGASRGYRQQPHALISPAPSVHSMRSDMSSHDGSQSLSLNLLPSPSQAYQMPGDTLSPASTSYEAPFYQVRPAMHGRAATFSSHTRGRGSFASMVSPSAPTTPIDPPGPRQTILDRAFQMRCVPGSEMLEGEASEKMTSMARFEALMREHDQRRQRHSTKQPHQKSQAESTLASVVNAIPALHDQDDQENTLLPDNEVDISTPAQRALAYISGRQTPTRSRTPKPTTPPIPFVTQNSMSSLREPCTTPVQGLSPRTHSSRHRKARPVSLIVTNRAMSDSTVSVLSHTCTSEKRMSNSSTRKVNLNFQEFTKNSTSTNSLLLAQADAASVSKKRQSKRHSVEYRLSKPADDDDATFHRAGSTKSKSSRRITRGTLMAGEAEKRCGWRGSSAMLASAEGGFI